MRAQALIFDMDGTMIDSLGHHRISWIRFAERHALAVDADELMRRTNGRTGVECMRELFGPGLPDDRAAALVDEKEALYRESFAPEFREIAGFCAFARRAAQRGLRVGVGTAGDRHNIRFALERLAMAPPPMVVIGGDQGLAGKPEPAIFLEVARRLGTSPADCIVFEDAPFGIEAARRAGMRAVAVCSTHRAEELAGPHVIAAIAHYDELDQDAFLNQVAPESTDHA